MGIPDRHPGSGDTRFTGTSTGQVQVGRFILDVPSPGGTTLSLAPRRARTEPPPELTTALAQDAQVTPDVDVAPDASDPPAQRDLVDRANKLLDTAEAVTDRVERVTNTVQALLEGRIPDPDLISEDLMDSLALLQRLTQSGRLAEVIKLGRPLCRLFALTLRWAALVETLRLVFHAATALADTPTIAWTQHELGTLHGSVGNVDRGRELLRQARRTREQIGDQAGLKATDQNLKILARRVALPKSTAAMAGAGIVVLIVAVLVFAETVSGGSSSNSVASSTTSSTARSSTTTDSSTTSHSTSVQVDTHPLTVTPAEVPFGTFAPGTVSDPRTITLTNRGQTPDTITSVQLGGTDPTEFKLSSGDCDGRTVPAQSSCTVAVSFTPTSAGSNAATVSFTDNAGSPIPPVSLSGTGGSPPAAAIRPPVVRFVPVTIGESGSTEVDLVNIGASPLAVTSAEISPGTNGATFTITSDQCSKASVASGTHCIVDVEFTPTAAGGATATLTFTDDADPSTQQVQLIGTGQNQVQTTTPTTPTTTTTSPPTGTATQPPLQ